MLRQAAYTWTELFKIIDKDCKNTKYKYAQRAFLIIIVHRSNLIKMRRLVLDVGKFLRQTENFTSQEKIGKKKKKMLFCRPLD